MYIYIYMGMYGRCGRCCPLMRFNGGSSVSDARRLFAPRCRGDVNKHVYAAETFVACARFHRARALRKKQRSTALLHHHTSMWYHCCGRGGLGFFGGAAGGGLAHRAPRALAQEPLANSYQNRKLAHGSEKAPKPEDRSFSPQQHRNAARAAATTTTITTEKRKKSNPETDCCMTAGTQNVALTCFPR